MSQDDFFNKSDRLRIELIFREMCANEAKNFTEWLGWEEITIITDRVSTTEQVPFLRIIYDVSRNIDEYYIIPSDIRAGTDENGTQLTAEAREYLKITYLKPLRDAYSELVPGKNSRLSQILQGHEAFKGKESTHILVGLFREFNSSVEQYFKGKDKDGIELDENNIKGKVLDASNKRMIETCQKCFVSVEFPHPMVYELLAVSH